MPLPPLHTLDELCERLHIKPKTLRRWLRSIDFAAIQGGDTLLFTDEDVIMIVEARRNMRRRGRTPRPRWAVDAPLSEHEIERRLTALRQKRVRKRHAPAGQ